MSVKILLVEDSKFLRMANEKVLIRAGYSVISVADGEQALAAAREYIPSLILLDMMLPKLDGVAVLRKLKRDPLTAHIPVVVVTGLGQRNEPRLLKEGAKAYFIKSDALFEDQGAALVRLAATILAESKPVQAPSV